MKQHCKASIVFVVMLGLFLSLSPKVRAETLHLVTEEYPPLNMTNAYGQVVGSATELLRAAANRINLVLDIRLLPWKRGYSITQKTPSTCIYSTWRTEEREAQFIWVGPLAKDAWSFYAREDKDIELKSIEDTFDYRVGGVDGWGFTTHLQELGYPLLDLAPVEDIINAQKLISNRIQLWATGRISGQQILKEKKFKGIKEVFAIREIGLWVACNPLTDRNLLKKLQTSLDFIQKNNSNQN